MTEFIAHRINTIKQLKDVPYNYGVEIDLRPFNDLIILEHDPFFLENEMILKLIFSIISIKL